MFTNAEEIIEIIEQRKNKGYGLQHFKDYMASIGNPQDKLKTIHIAGTNGKGSTTNNLRSILQEAGYQVGSFTSPYMITHLDRIRINDIYIKEDDFIALSNEHYDTWMKWELSMFEIDTCLAVLYFLKYDVDYAIFEVGLGGKKDSTNILKPVVSVITNIGLDHMELLGDSVEEIAKEKAGIIKEHIDVITAEQKSSCLAIFQAHASSAKASCYQIGHIKNIHIQEDAIHFDYRLYKNIKLYSLAAYQCKNAALAIEVIAYLQRRQWINVSEQQLRNGLAKAVWFGRFEVIHQHPMVILDGAHNTDGIQALVSSLDTIAHPKIIFSVLKDKNFEEMITLLQTISDDITLCQFQNERAIDVHDFDMREGIRVEANYRKVLKEALKQQRTVVITGSLYFISEVRKYWNSSKAALGE